MSNIAALAKLLKIVGHAEFAAVASRIVEAETLAYLVSWLEDEGAESET